MRLLVRNHVRVLKLLIGSILLATLVYLLPIDHTSDQISIPSMYEPWFTEGVIGNYEPGETSPGDGPGEGGPYVHSIGDPDEVKRLKKIYGINMAASDAISLERWIPDTRMDECKYWNYYPEMGLKASVVIAFYNEGLSTLLRNIHQILKSTPKEFLEEIVLVDDFSDKDNLKKPLEEHVEQINSARLTPIIRLLRNGEREGLIRTRAIGAENSVGDVVVFLDAHCEVNRNWLPPLLAPIYRDRTVITVPFIDGINHENFEYHPVYKRDSLFRGIFDWGLLYKEIEVSPEEVAAKKYKSAPYKAPTHAGGLFAVDRRYFVALGGYDPGLLGWGAENFELSFKVWQCGGSLEWVPCSRVGHIYRGVPYGFGKLAEKAKGSIVKINYKRVVEVWMDDKYKEFFYTREPLNRYLDHGDISKQLAIKQEFNCKPFSWFMENVAHDVLKKFPELPKNLFWGELRNKGSNACMDNLGKAAPSEPGTSNCHGQGSNQLFRLNAEGQLGVGERCIEIENSVVKQIYCPLGHVDGPWAYDIDTGIMRHKPLDKCLAVHPSKNNLIVQDCELSNTYHRWIWKKLTLRY